MLDETLTRESTAQDDGIFELVILRSPVFLSDDVRIPSFKIFMEKNMKDKKIKRYEPVEIATTSKNEVSQ